MGLLDAMNVQVHAQLQHRCCLLVHSLCGAISPCVPIRRSKPTDHVYLFLAVSTRQSNTVYMSSRVRLKAAVTLKAIAHSMRRFITSYATVCNLT